MKQDALIKAPMAEIPKESNPPMSTISHATEGPSVRKTDYWWIFGIAILGIAGSLYLGHQIDPVVFQRQIQDTWFDADIYRVVSDMTSRTSSHFRANVHPLFSLLLYPVTVLIETVCGKPAIPAVKIVLAMAAGALLGLFFLLLRFLGCRRLDACLFTLLLATSATSVFWLGVPDTFMFGAVTILLALCVAAIAAGRKLFKYWFLVVSALTLSCTTTNWMAGIVTTFAYNRWKQAIQLTINAFFIVVVLWGLENFFFQGVNFFLVLRSERSWMLLSETGGWLAIAKVFFVHSVVMPEITVLNTSSTVSVWPLLSIQKSALASGSILGLPAVILWAGLFLSGLYTIVTHRDKMRFKIVLGLVLVGQFSLHLLYGRETFLFAPHFAPLLILVAALGTQTKARRMILFASIVLILCCVYNNGIQFGKANQYIHAFSQQRAVASIDTVQIGEPATGPFIPTNQP